MKRVIVSALAVFGVLVLLYPLRFKYKDGGTVTYRALTYSVSSYHSLSMVDGVTGHIVGTEIVILGKSIYDNTHFTPLLQQNRLPS